MDIKDLKVGDRVEMVDTKYHNPYGPAVGSFGTVQIIGRPGVSLVNVEWDSWHVESLGKKIDSYFVLSEQLELCPKES